MFMWRSEAPGLRLPVHASPQVKAQAQSDVINTLTDMLQEACGRGRRRAATECDPICES